MAYLNANIPPTYAQIRKEYLYDLKKHKGEVADCIIFGLSALTGRAILFHAIMENGAIFYRLPISAFIQTGFDPRRVPARRLDELQLWNCFSYYPSVHRWDILDGQAGKYIGKDKKWHITHFTTQKREVNRMLKNPKTDRDLHHLHQGFQKKIGDRLKGNLKRIQKENRTLKRVRKEKKDSIYFPDKVTRFTNKVSNCFENSSIGCTILFPRINYYSLK